VNKSPEHQETARAMAKAMDNKDTEKELRRLCEEIMYQKFLPMDKNELSELGWHRKIKYL
tara:strand:- start:167 stop:346 length:180 start_codon:yes stop_codon:yes gene_type:complete